ncbi:MAG: O-antigen ligase family protein [Bradyrhizobium sp.]|nr:O-antigen ligase family protein [Bradyrhizobium sp.]
MSSNNRSNLLQKLAAATATIATFAKSFVPFYLIGSTAIFVTSSVVASALVAINWRQLRADARQVSGLGVGFAALYGLVVANYLLHTLGKVPATHLLGILVFHGLFLVLGFSAVRALPAVFAVLAAFAASYVLVIAQYTVRFGDPMRAGYLEDIFNIGVVAVSITFHQNIGVALGLAVLAGYAFATTRIRLLWVIAVTLALMFLYHIAARTAIAGVLCALAFLLCGYLCRRSRALAAAGLVALLLSTAVASGLFYRFAIQDRNVDEVAPDAISRTIRELQDPRPQFRMQIWLRAGQRIAADPARLPLGRGIGAYPIDEGFGAPDWLLHPTEGSKYYPHNVYLEMLYENGLLGVLLLAYLTLFPLIFALGRWGEVSETEKSAIAMYVFSLAGVAISGSFAYSYDFQFFLGMAIGVVALNRARLARNARAQQALSELRAGSLPSS